MSKKNHKNDHRSLNKEYITRCIICGRYIPEDLQTSQRKTCGKGCQSVHKTNIEFRRELSTMTMGPVKK